MADNLQTKTEKLIKYGNEKFGLNETSLRGILDNAAAGGQGGQYNIEVVKKTDGNGKVTQALHITDASSSPSFDPIFGNNSWEQIAEASKIIAKNKYTSREVAVNFGWLLGDTKTDIGIDGKTRTIRIIDYNHDDLSDGTGKAGISLDLAGCEKFGYRMNNENTNAGGYAASEMKTETLPTFKALLSSELQSVIKTVNKKSANGGADNFSEVLTTSEELFLLSEVEVLNRENYAQNGLDEGFVYELYNQLPATAIKNQFLWLRSSSKKNTTDYVYLKSTNVDTGSYTPKTTSVYLSYALCI